ncbi:sensor histidine kinase [Nocardioides guangzhouensis]|uniref:sensor histidine kinase n=1 Tax=Nocardioides guangzhouensis TaxID=2497878 RepID=UPI001C37755F|nr:GAF domain-containing sensor histidine kinase [Nocardioides guangzhouensis]
MNAVDSRSRVATLERYQVLDQPPRRELVALVELAARVSGVPMATINLITDVEQHQVATVGFDGAVCSYDDAMCTVVVEGGEAVATDDARSDDRFRANPFVTGPLGNVRFYASHPLTTPDGVTVGTLCVFDDEPRHLGAEDAGMLSTLAGRVMDVLELELRTRQLETALDQLQEANHQLETSNDRLAAFAGQVSHDLKNPLTALGMSLGLLEEELEDSGALDDALALLLKRAASGATRMETMIGDLLEFARIGGSPNLQPVDLAIVVADAMADLDGEVVPAMVTVKKDLPVVLGDQTQLRLVLQNLLGNAVKFVVPGVGPEIIVAASETADGWRVEVADRGRGVAEVDRERVFEPLARLDKRVPGNGIGLATCRRIVSAHGGTIGLDPRPGGGTVAWFELPGRV